MSVPTKNTITHIRNRIEVRVGTSAEHASDHGRSFQRALRPYALVFLALAIAVISWGFGYRLSRYSTHQDTGWRVSVAKLWDKHQIVEPTPAHELKAKTVSDLHVAVLGAEPALSSGPEISTAVLEQAAYSYFVFFQGPNSLRAPPVQSSHI